MKPEQLYEYLEDDLAWRKKELSSLSLMAEKHPDNVVILKSLILLLYAHWEGYIKKSSKIYLKYISESKTKLKELTENFKAVALKDAISQCFNSVDSLTLQNEINVINKFSKNENKNFRLKVDVDNDFENSIIDTKRNLTPKVFRNIHSVIGLNYKRQLDLKENHINIYLLAKRHLIAHGGKYIEKDDDEFLLKLNDIKKLRDIILSIIDNFKDELIEYVDKEYFLVKNQDSLKEFLLKKEQELEKSFKDIEDLYEESSVTF